MKRLVLVLAGAALAAPAIAACGSLGTDDLFTSGGAGGAGGAPAASTGATHGPSGSTTTVGPGGGPASSSADVASSTASATVASSSSTVASSSSGMPVQVYCNGNPCEPGAVCCFNPNGAGDHCGTAGQCNPGYVEFDCNGPEDCPGGACCATVNFQMQVPYLGMQCQPSCDPNTQIVVCSEQDPGVCPMGSQCLPSQSIGNGYAVCWPM